VYLFCAPAPMAASNANNIVRVFMVVSLLRAGSIRRKIAGAARK
jgi:hypothetical protein